MKNSSRVAAPLRRPCRRAVSRPASNRLLAKIGRDVSALLDAHDEATNNLTRGETDFLRDNLRTCRHLARRIERRTKSVGVRRLLASNERTGR